MNHIHRYLKEMFDELIEYRRAYVSSLPINNPEFPHDFYDVILELWNAKVLTDPQLTMDALHAVYCYKKYIGQDGLKLGCRYKVDEDYAGREITQVLDNLSEHLTERKKR
jgi:hypothetical protein